MTRKKILAVSGSIRTRSTNEALLHVIRERYAETLDVELYDGLATLPHFNPDTGDDHLPEAVARWRTLIQQADGIIICTPEYVFSVPGALKNAIEWTVSTTVFFDKPVAIIVASGVSEKTHESLTLIMKTVGAKIGDHATLLIQGGRGKVSPDGKIKDDLTSDAIDIVMQSFLGTIAEPVVIP